jgi:hypothetical protein
MTHLEAGGASGIHISLILRYHNDPGGKHMDDSAFGLEEIYSRSLACVGSSEGKRLIVDFHRKFPGGSAAGAGLFPFFLANRKWPAVRGFLPDLAALEWSLRLAERAPELPLQGLERVVSASEPQWFTAQFRFDPAHAVMVSDWPLDEVFEHPTAAHTRRPGKYLIYRMQGKARVRGIDENEGRLLEALALGVPLGIILERPGGPEFDAFLFHEWMQSGLLREIHWAS